MESDRPLRDAFSELLEDESARAAYTADPDGFLASYGHSGLPDELLTEAIVSFADTAPEAVAEYLAPFVMANAAVPLDLPAAQADSMSGLDLLATAPFGQVDDSPVADLLSLDQIERGGAGDTGDLPGFAEPRGPLDDAALVDDLDFGTGSAQAVPRSDGGAHGSEHLGPDEDLLSGPESDGSSAPDAFAEESGGTLVPGWEFGQFDAAALDLDAERSEREAGPTAADDPSTE